MKNISKYSKAASTCEQLSSDMMQNEKFTDLQNNFCNSSTMEYNDLKTDSECENSDNDLSPQNNTKCAVEVENKNPGVKCLNESKKNKIDKFVKRKACSNKLISLNDALVNCITDFESGDSFDILMEESNKNSLSSNIFSNSLNRKRKMLYPSVVDVLLKRNKSKLSSSVSNNIHTKKYDVKVNGFGIGDLVWAKMGKYPVWPGIVIEDPESNIFSKKENTILLLHVYFCNDTFRHNWMRMNQIFKFSCKKTIIHEMPKILSQISRNKQKVKWNKAVDEAEILAAMNKESRVDAFFANDLLPPNVQWTNKSQTNNLKSKSKVEACSKDSAQNEKASTQDLTGIVSTNSLFKHMNNQNISYEEKKLFVNEKSSTQDLKGSASTNSLIVPNKNKKESNGEKQNCIKNLPKDHPRILIPELCKLFYSKDWITGTGGSISIKYNDQIFIAPTGVQKERMKPEDIFVLDMKGVDIEIPNPEKNLVKSRCTPIFMFSYTERNAGAIIHIHSPGVIKLCLLNPENEIRISDLEMIRGIYNEKKKRYYENDEEVVIPIIENSKYASDLVDMFKMALTKYPSTSAVLVRNHGLYVWGTDWKSAKSQCESYEFMFNMMVFKKTLIH